jgi:transcriptional regulator with XRE-family HTH domain
MNAAISNPDRFRAARERAGLSIAETAAKAGVSEPRVWDLESYDDELMMTCSPADLQRFAGILSVAPRELVGTEQRGDPISADELASAIREYSRARNRTLDEFGDAAGWDVSKVANAPQLLLSEFPLDGIRDICRELGLDWQRFISGLSAAA